MKPIDENVKNRYFTELAVALKRDGLETMLLTDGNWLFCWMVTPSVKSAAEAVSGIDRRI